MPGGDAGRAQRKAEERGTDPGGDPVPCHSQAVSVHAGCRASRPEKPQCQSFVRNPARLPSPDSSPGEEGCGCQNHRSGQENSPCNGAARGWYTLNRIVPPGNSASPPIPWQQEGDTHTHTQMRFSFRATTIGRRAISLQQQDIYGLWGCVRREQAQLGWPAPVSR